VFASGDACREMIAKLTFRQFEGCGREYDRRGVRAASDVLAVATVALDHHQWLRGALVSDIATITTTGDGECNGERTHPAHINWLGKSF
jgi:hypothetical protein